MPTINAIVTYLVSNAGTPAFLNGVLNADGTINTERVQSLAPNTPILRLTGTIRKGNANATPMKAKTLTITASKWLNPKTRILPNVAQNTISVTVPEFAKGRGNQARSINPEAAATLALLNAFSK